MSQKAKMLIVASCVFVAFFFIISFYAVSKSIERLSTTPAVYNHQILALKKGDNASVVVDSLVKNPVEKFIDHLWLKYHKEYTSIQKGDYLVDGKKSVLDILKDMVQGNVVEKIYPTFTVVEGSNYAKIMRKIAARKKTPGDAKFHSLLKNKNKFLNKVLEDNPELLEFIGKDLNNLEGLISPATYEMYEDSPLYRMFKRGIIAQLKTLQKEWENREESENIKTPYEALILASLIERETFLDSERAKVAAVFENRLTKKMRLQTDPAVMYGVSQIFTGKLTRAHLRADTPYNTYTREGLPPTPICMPREKSIYAALHPEKINSLYFVAQGISPKDGHAFSATLSEHNKAVSNYRKKVKAYYLEQKKEEESDDDLIVAEAEEQKTADKPIEDITKVSVSQPSTTVATKENDSKKDSSK